MWDLEQMIGQRPARKANGQFAKGIAPHNKGKKWFEWMSPEGREKVLQKLKHNGNPHFGGCNARPIAGVKDKKVVFFESSKDAERKTGICARNIRHVCEKKRNFAGGCRWFYADDGELKQFL